MSSSSYEPEEDDEASDSEIEYKPAPASSRAPQSSPPIQALRLSSSVEPVAQDDYELVPRSVRGTRAETYENLRMSLTKDSVAGYSRLLEELANFEPGATPGEGYNITQNGIVTWTAREKEVFHTLLDRKGKNGVKEIAKAIGTKSELEVLEHLRLLHKGLERQHLRDRHSRTIVLGDVPAAAEISDQCSAVLDQYSEFVSLEEQYTEDVAGKQKHHDAWIIDYDKAQELHGEIVEKEEKNEEPVDSSVYLSASLFNMKKWIRLSERFFMNPGGSRLEDNWVNIAFGDETPSVTADAFGDLYALTISVTRRLVQSSIFFAMSRIRNMRETGHSKAQVVRSRDVKTALDVLNMKRDRYDYWIGLARRCSLEVADLRHRKGWSAMIMDHDEVEDILSGEMDMDEISESGSRPRSGSRVRGSPGSEMDQGNESDSASSVLSSPEVSGEEEVPSDPENEHAERIDQKHNNLEELQLWESLKRPAPSHLNSVKEESPKAERKPVGERKTQQELIDWRDRTMYRNDWEEHGNDVFDIYEEISENRRKRRRIEDKRLKRLKRLSDSVESWNGVVSQQNSQELADAIYNGHESGTEVKPVHQEDEQDHNHNHDPDPDPNPDQMDLDEDPALETSNENHELPDQDHTHENQNSLEPEDQRMSIEMPDAEPESHPHPDDQNRNTPNQNQNQQPIKPEPEGRKSEYDTDSEASDEKSEPDQGVKIELEPKQEGSESEETDSDSGSEPESDSQSNTGAPVKVEPKRGNSVSESEADSESAPDADSDSQPDKKHPTKLEPRAEEDKNSSTSQSPSPPSTSNRSSTSEPETKPLPSPSPSPSPASNQEPIKPDPGAESTCESDGDHDEKFDPGHRVDKADSYSSEDEGMRLYSELMNS